MSVYEVLLIAVRGRELNKLRFLPLKLLFDISIKTSLLPIELKRALVCPIHKSGPNQLF